LEKRKLHQDSIHLFAFDDDEDKEDDDSKLITNEQPNLTNYTFNLMIMLINIR
jgi:hypothetical protein